MSFEPKARCNRSVHGRTMREERLLSVVALLLALVAGLLLILAGARLPRNPTFDDLILGTAVPLILGLGILLGGLAIIEGQYATGGVVCLVLGILVYAVGEGSLNALLAIAGGILGLIANSLRSHRFQAAQYRR